MGFAAPIMTQVCVWIHYWFSFRTYYPPAFGRLSAFWKCVCPINCLVGPFLRHPLKLILLLFKNLSTRQNERSVWLHNCHQSTFCVAHLGVVWSFYFVRSPANQHPVQRFLLETKWLLLSSVLYGRMDIWPKMSECRFCVDLMLETYICDFCLFPTEKVLFIYIRGFLSSTQYRHSITPRSPQGFHKKPWDKAEGKNLGLFPTTFTEFESPFVCEAEGKRACTRMVFIVQPDRGLLLNNLYRKHSVLLLFVCVNAFIGYLLYLG